MSFAVELKCTGCGSVFPVDEPYRFCPRCRGVLLVSYDYDAVSSDLSRKEVQVRPPGIWRYFELLPINEVEHVVSLGEGGTELRKCTRLAQKLGIRNLYVKDETTNPTGHFLDRATAVDVSKAVELGFTYLKCVGSGSEGASVAAYAARANLGCSVLLPAHDLGKIDLFKIYQMVAYGANIEVEKEGAQRAKALQPRGAEYCVSLTGPFFVEGEKTTGYETLEQLNWESPERVIVPMGNGTHLSMIWKGIKEMQRTGLLDEPSTMMTGVQVFGCAPIVEALRGGREVPEPALRAETIAPDLAMTKPLHGALAIQSIRESRGRGVVVSTDEILEATSLLARTEGIFAEPAAASTIAGLKKLLETGEAARSETVVCVVTGRGMKDASTIRRLVERVKNIDEILAGNTPRESLSRLGRTKLKILQLVSKKESYGYGLADELRKKYGIQIDVSSVYQHLLELERMRLVRRTEVKSVLGRPRRKYYAVTTLGRELLNSPRTDE